MERESGNLSKRKKGVGILVGIILVLLVGGLGFLSWWTWGTKPYSPTGKSEKITITPGTTVDQLAVELQQRHLIRSAWAFGIWRIQSKMILRCMLVIIYWHL